MRSIKMESAHRLISSLLSNGTRLVAVFAQL